MLKIVSLGIGFIAVPISLNYLGKESYGTWATVLSVIAWFGMMDVGIGNGFRNHVGVAVAQGDHEKVKELSSTAYLAMGAIAVVFSVVFTIVLFFIPLQDAFRVDPESATDLFTSVLLSGWFFAATLVLSLYNQAFYALQKTSMTGVGQFLGAILSLGFLVVVVQSEQASLTAMAIVYGGSNLLVGIAMSAYLFVKHRQFSPDLKCAHRRSLRPILGLGMKFFIVQVASVVLFLSTNMIIIQLLSTSAVTDYSLLQKIFQPISVGVSFLMTPLWSAYTEAFAKKDYAWIRKTLRRVVILMAPIIGSVVILAYFVNTLLSLWVGQDIRIEDSAIAAMAALTVVALWTNIFAFFLTGSGHMRLSVIVTVVAAVVYVPLAYVLCVPVHWGLAGIVVASVVCQLPGLVLGPVQTYLILRTSDKPLAWIWR